MLTYVVVFRALLADGRLNLYESRTLTKENVQEFLMDLHIKNGWTSWTFNRYRKNLKIFFEYMRKNRYIDENPMEDIPKRRESSSLPKALSAAQLKKVFAAIAKLCPEQNSQHIRYRAIFYTYAYTGMRLAELMNLTIEDVNLEERQIRIVKGKGGKDRIVPIPQTLYDILLAYSSDRNSMFARNDKFFLNHSRNPLTRADLKYLFAKLKKVLDFRITCHMFRHTFATELANKNLNVQNIASILGHSNIRTTQIYMHFNTKIVRETIDAVGLYA